MPGTAEQFEAALAGLNLLLSRRSLRQRWTEIAERAGLPAIDAMPNPSEPTLLNYAKQFTGLLDWWEHEWKLLRDACDRAGLRWDTLREREVARAAPLPPFDRDCETLQGPLLSVVEARQAVVRSVSAEIDLQEMEAGLADYRGPVCTRLRRAVAGRQVAECEAALEDLHDLRAKEELVARRADLLHRTGAAAPAWANALRLRAGVHGGTQIPGSVAAAWKWRQLVEELERRAALDEVALTRQLEQRRTELRRTTARLIESRAWLGQLRRTNLAARQALEGWVQTQRKIGKGHGKRVPELLARARVLLAHAREAVPVWIMPLARVAESFDPRAGRFEVVIVDEASQSDVVGLLAWYLGSQIVVVGDHEQVSPSAIGQTIAGTTALIAQHLHGIPNAHLYDGQTSIYDLAKASFGGTIALREHFRCVPDIIEFSNHLSYNGTIRPLRDPETAPKPHVVEIVVPSSLGVDRSGRTNRAEAQMVAALAAATMEMPQNAGKTFGAITLLGDEQSSLIQELLLRLKGAVELSARRFVAGNSAQFQGDERHLIFLSMVDVPTGTPLPMKQQEMIKQRYNVAASRAKDQLWLVHSLDPSRDLKEGDLRRRLIEHMRDPQGRRRALADSLAKAESPFEEEVTRRLVAASYRVRCQVEVGYFRIDLVVTDGKSQIAVECDGDKYHGFDKIPEDMARQAVLERAGWRFIRIRGSRFFSDPDETMAWVFSELERLGMAPVGPVAESAEDLTRAAFRDAAMQRAWEIMRQEGWAPLLNETPGT